MIRAAAGRRRAAPATVWIVTALVLGGFAAAGGARAAEPAAGGDALLEAAEGALATVVGVVRTPARVDTHGWAASLEIERTLAGPLTAGSVQRIAWEELALARPARFAAGDRIAVALVALPGTSLWAQRFPPAGEGPRVLVVAAEGDAFLRRPDPRTLDLLARYLALPAAERGSSPGIAALAGLVQEADPVVASAALRRLGTVPELGAQLDEEARQALAGAARDEARPLALRRALLAAIGRQRLTALRPTLEELASAGAPLEAAALEALAALDGGLPRERTEALLESRDPELRAVGVRLAATPQQIDALAGLLRNDPSPDVRAAAAETLAARRGADAVDDVASGLFDAEPSVRAAAARALGGVGEPAVATLLRLTMARTGSETHAPIVALSLTGAAGSQALLEIAGSHPDPMVRKVARLALGEGPGENEAVLDPRPPE